MTLALSTLFFLAVGWLALQVIVRSLDGKLDRVTGALRGEVPTQVMPVTLRVSPRYPSLAVRRAQPTLTLRAAA
jgi:hypothetical protein